jgi:hypothetical protein
LRGFCDGFGALCFKQMVCERGDIGCIHFRTLTRRGVKKQDGLPRPTACN